MVVRSLNVEKEAQLLRPRSAGCAWCCPHRSTVHFAQRRDAMAACILGMNSMRYSHSEATGVIHLQLFSGRVRQSADKKQKAAAGFPAAAVVAAYDREEGFRP